VGRRTETFLRFSTVAGGRGSADAVRDPRGFALKFYTEEGNYDLVGNNTPIFFIRDPLKFPDFIHSQKPDPFTNHQEPDNVWDFFSRSPEATHMFTWLFGDRGIPASYRHMDGFGSHTYQWANDRGEAVWVKYHFVTDQGIRCLDASEATELAGLNPDSHQLDLIGAVEAGDLPSWTLKVQIMPMADAGTYRINPFDLTKVWPHADYPLIEVGRLTLDRNADNYFGDVEQAGFDPGNFVPGIGPSPDKMLQGRLFAYGDAHRYRLGINHTQLPVNAPHAAEVDNYGRDGLMAGRGNGGRVKNYEPNSFGGPVETGRGYAAPLAADGPSGPYPWDDRATDDFSQAGDLYRLQPPAAQQRLVDNLAVGISGVSPGPIGDGIVERSIAHFGAADGELGDRVAQGVKERRG
jgi:catalase